MIKFTFVHQGQFSEDLWLRAIKYMKNKCSWMRIMLDCDSNNFFCQFSLLWQYIWRNISILRKTTWWFFSNALNWRDNLFLLLLFALGSVIRISNPETDWNDDIGTEILFLLLNHPLNFLRGGNYISVNTSHLLTNHWLWFQYFLLSIFPIMTIYFELYFKSWKNNLVILKWSSKRNG